MTPDQLRQYYEAKAKEAEGVAESVRDAENKQRWLAIAEGYRVLARGRYDGVPR